MSVPDIGVSTSPLKDVVEDLEGIGKMGMEFAELTIEEPLGTPYYMARHREGIKRVSRKYGMFLTGHAAWWIELGNPHESVRRSWVKESLEMLDCCGKLGVRSLNFHLHVQGEAFLKNPKARKKVLDNTVRSLRELVRKGKKLGVEILLENIPKKKFGVKDMKYILDRVPEAGMTLDVAHAFVEGGTGRVLEYIKAFKGRIRHVHVGDNNGRMDQHLAVGEGKIPWKRVVKALKGIGYDRGIVLEVFYSGKRKAYTDSRKRILGLWKGQR